MAMAEKKHVEEMKSKINKLFISKLLAIKWNNIIKTNN